VPVVHRAVMLREVTEFLSPQPGDVIVDATVGGGGHAREILRQIRPGGRLIGIDADAAAIERSRAELATFGDSVVLMQENFRNMDEVLKRAGVRTIDGVLFDLGISSYQFEDAARGFGFRNDGPLDMRMGTGARAPAQDVVNRLPERSLADVIFRFGEERYSRRIARSICEARGKEEISSTARLARIVAEAVPPRYRHGRIHPATRTFQAIRIYVNDELGALEEGLRKAVEHLEGGARVVVLSFHSLEDRIVKNTLKDLASRGTVGIMTKKPVAPSEDEVLENPRSRSAKLRAAERVRVR